MIGRDSTEDGSKPQQTANEKATKTNSSTTNGSHPAQAPPKTYRWEVAPQATCAQALIEQYQVHPLVARILASRGWEPGDCLERFIRPLLRTTHDPFGLRDMGCACDRLVRAVEEREPIVVFGDYDVDGSTATALLVSTFRFLNVPVAFYIPDRLSEGYGISIDALEELSRKFRLIVSVDTGTTCVAEADWARRHGIDLVLTDHHRAGDELPDAIALVNPNRPDCTYPEKGLAGVGVAFKLAHALLKRANVDSEKAVEFLCNQLDLVAIGTICDMVPLTGENRAFVRQGLKVADSGNRVGLRALKIVSGFERDQPMTPRNVGFGIGPRLNAAGRTSHASLAVDLLLEEDEHKAFALAEKLDQMNDERRKIERNILDQTLKSIEEQCDVEQDKVIVCSGRGWHVGIIGIVASRVLERFSRPAIVCAVDERGVGKGSGRSIDAFDLHGALNTCSGHLVEFGGHTHAAGLRILEENIPAFRESINQIADANLTLEDLIPSLSIDAEILFDEISFDAVRAIEELAPFGQANRQPMLMLRGVSIDGTPRVVGRNHLKMRVRNGTSAPIDVIGFGQAHHLKTIMEGAMRVDLCGALSINEFRGASSLQFEMKDMRLAS